MTWYTWVYETHCDVFLDQHRQFLLGLLAWTLMKACQKGIWGAQGFNAVVSGPKGCGKTHFLQELVVFMAEVAGPRIEATRPGLRVQALFIDCTFFGEDFSLVDILNAELRWDLVPTGDF